LPWTQVVTVSNWALTFARSACGASAAEAGAAIPVAAITPTAAVIMILVSGPELVLCIF
jgi:hypothetical protein